MCIHIEILGVCCFGFSVFAIIFLLIVSGVLNSGSTVINIDESIRYSAADNCQYAAGVYAGFIVLSSICYILGRYSESSSLSANEEKLKLINSKHNNTYQRL